MKESKWLLLLGGLLVIVAGTVIVLGIYLFLQLEKTLAAAVLAGGLSLIGFSLKNVMDRRLEERRLHRDGQLEAYRKFVETVSKFMVDSSAGSKPVSNKRLIEMLLEFRAVALIHGSKDLIRTYNAWSIGSAVASAQGDDLSGRFSLAAMARLLSVMRKDLGHRDTGLHESQLLQIFMKEPVEDLGEQFKQLDLLLTASQVAKRKSPNNKASLN